MWVLNQPWLATRETDVTWTPEEVRGLQIELVVAITIVISLIMTMMGCCCLRLPHRIRNGLRHLTHALRVWKSKLPPAKDWGIWTCVTAMCSGFTHCVLCCLYKKDRVKDHVEAANEFELHTLDSQGRRIFSDWRRHEEQQRPFSGSTFRMSELAKKDEDGFYDVQLTPPSTYDVRQGLHSYLSNSDILREVDYTITYKRLIGKVFAKPDHAYYNEIEGHIELHINDSAFLRTNSTKFIKYTGINNPPSNPIYQPISNHNQNPPPNHPNEPNLDYDTDEEEEVEEVEGNDVVDDDDDDVRCSYTIVAITQIQKKKKTRRDLNSWGVVYTSSFAIKKPG